MGMENSFNGDSELTYRYLASADFPKYCHDMITRTCELSNFLVIQWFYFSFHLDNLIFISHHEFIWNIAWRINFSIMDSISDDFFFCKIFNKTKIKIKFLKCVWFLNIFSISKLLVVALKSFGQFLSFF